MGQLFATIQAEPDLLVFIGCLEALESVATGGWEAGRPLGNWRDPDFDSLANRV
jgi:hypothetical protein